MKQILIITLLFILQSIPSFGGSLNGKGLVCVNIIDPDNFVNSYVGFHFENEFMYEYYFNTDKDKVSLRNVQWDYKTDEKYIWWLSKMYGGYFPPDGHYHIDRKTLRLYMTVGKKLMFQCEVVDNKTEFDRRLNVTQNLLQSVYDGRMKDNKI